MRSLISGKFRMRTISVLSRLTKDYDVITTAEFLDLHARGKISTPQSVDLSLAQYTPPPKKNKKAKAKA